MQTILGAGGAIGNELARALTRYTRNIRLVSRNPEKVNPTDEIFSCDLTNKNQVLKAVEGSQIVYLTVGLEYKISVWQTMWPKIMENVINACKVHNSKLVFFDNIYMLDPDHLDHMNEETPVRPVSKKGAVRAKIAQMILDEVDKGKLTALIARAADFYGPGVQVSVLQETVYKNFLKGKKANWFCSLDYLHDFTYTPDAGKATAILGNDPEAYNQIWHLPTANPKWTGKDWINAFANEMNVEPKHQVAGKFIIKIMGWFNSIMKELYEMLYQYDRDYVFESHKFEKKYDFKPTAPEKAIKEIIQHDSND